MFMKLASFLVSISFFLFFFLYFICLLLVLGVVFFQFYTAPGPLGEKERNRKIEFKAYAGWVEWRFLFAGMLNNDNHEIQHFTSFSFIFLEFKQRVKEQLRF